MSCKKQPSSIIVELSRTRRKPAHDRAAPARACSGQCRTCPNNSKNDPKPIE